MNKSELIELVRRNLQGGDAPVSVRAKYDPRLVEKYVEIVYNDLVYMLYNDGVKMGGDFSALDNFGKSYKRQLKYDSDREEYYIDAEMDIVPLPDNQGIRQVSPWLNQANSFDYRDNNSQGVFSLLFNDLVSPRPWFYTELPYIFVGNIPVPKGPKTQPTDLLMLKVIPPFSKLDATDEVFIPGGNNLRLFELVYNVVNQVNQNPQSQYDNNSNKQV